MYYLKSLLLPLIIFLFFSLHAQEQKSFAVSSFKSVKFEGSAKFVLVPSSVEKVIIESKNSDVFDYIDIHNDGSTLVVSATGKNKNITKLFKSVTIEVYFKSLVSITLSGAGSVICEKPFSSQMLTAILRGAGNIDLDVSCTKFTGHMHGTGLLHVRGTAVKAFINVDGVGGFSGYDLVTKDMEVTVSGVGGAEVHATEKLKATLNGVGSIRYTGNPEVKNFNTNGLGSIRKAKEEK